VIQSELEKPPFLKVPQEPRLDQQWVVVDQRKLESPQSEVALKLKIQR